VTTHPFFQKTEQFFSAVFHHSPNGISAISPQYDILAINQQFSHLTGFTAEQLLGKKCYAVFSQGSICHNCPVKKSLQTLKPAKSIKLRQHVSGSAIFIEQTAIPILNDAGTPEYVIEIIVDITKQMELEQSNKQLFFDTITGLVNLLESRDPYTSAHSARVRDIALNIAKTLALSQKATDEIAIAAILHDIGKIGVPEVILNKPGRLTLEEYRIIQEHTQIGYTALKAISSLDRIPEYILYHHEAYDGTGYPTGLCAEAIPFPSRIIHVADVYDALTSHRVYRNAMTHEETMDIFKNERGRQFDPQIVDALIDSLIYKKKLVLPCC